MSKHIGILTSGGDTPGLNAAIRGIGKAAIRKYDMSVIGFRDGFKGLMQNRHVRLDGEALSGILTHGGTILGTSREKPHRMAVGGKKMDMTQVIKDNIEAHHLDALVCLGGGGTQKNALKLMEAGISVITLPKTIDRDVWGTDITFGFDTALNIATEAIDRLHSTAHSHHRIIVVEIMGHKAGWLTLGAGLAGGADVILIPEIPYDAELIAETIKARRSGGSNFSIVAVAEGAMSAKEYDELADLEARREAAESGDERSALKAKLAKFESAQKGSTARLAATLEELTGLEARVTILGHVQRGGTPSPADRLLATRLGTKTADLVADGVSGVMVAIRQDEVVPVPLEEVAGKRSVVPLDHPWIESARSLGVGLGRGPE
ncbi:MAG: 6-phosphofructokinase [Acidimicrobiia bacterium]|nr:6-phosphofructokinase [Acidimicrobiia bacterium]NNF63372.1 6-phosphofructokinase [Acidimicrobiia bacterium]